MDFIILTHIILGSILSLFIGLTIYYLLKMLITPDRNKAIFSARLRQSSLITLLLFVVYIGWIFIKKSFFE